MAALKWERAKKYNKSINCRDEGEFEKKDGAGRWLAQKEGKAQKTKKPSRKSGKLVEDVGVVVFTDGACEPNPGRGGWGFVVYEDGLEVHSCCGGLKRTTNNAMELTGLLMALEWLRENAGAAIIYSDSQYVVNGCNSWRVNWRKKGWRRGKPLVPVKNKEIWIEIDALLNKASVKVRWCKGHDGIQGNERADKLASKGRNEAKGQ